MHCIHAVINVNLLPPKIYVKNLIYMRKIKHVLFLVEAHNMMYYNTILQQSLPNENSITLKKTSLKSPFQKFS